MAWTTARVPYDPHTRSSASMQEAMLMWDEALITAHVLKESTPPNQYVMRGSTLHHHHLPHTFFPFSLRDSAGDHVHNMPMSGSMASACGDIRQAMETMKRPLFWPSLEGERVKGTLSPECNAVHEQSGSTSEFCNVSNTTIMERMLSNEEVEMNFNEGESRIRKKKRLTGEQVKTLEHSFDADKKLEAERKQDLARRLGLEPRQVAVWFQNRRARSKTKHLEQDFALLKSKYHSLLAETHKLRSEVSRLTAELEGSRGETSAVKPGISPKLQIAPDHVPLRNSTSHRFSTKNVKSNSVAEAAHTVHESSTLLGDSGGKHAVTNYSGIKQSATASPLISHTQENSHDNNVVEGDYNIGPACISAEDQQYQLELHAPCSELVACLTEATFTRLENTDIGHSSSFAAYLKKVNAAFHDIHKLQAGDDCLQPLRLWELTA